MPDDLTLLRFHDVIQIAMGWFDSHLHEFNVGDRVYGTPDPDFLDPNHKIYQERNIKLSAILKKDIKSFTYTYDFGDHWEHEIIFEKTLAKDPSLTYPLFVTGKRRCPPEDVGGPMGYFDFLEAITNPAHPEHKENLQWVGGGFDPEELDHRSIEMGLEGIARRRRSGKRKKQPK